jgi:hypothetical protein
LNFAGRRCPCNALSATAQARRQPEVGFDAEALRASERARARSLLEMLAEARAEIRQGSDPQLVARERSLQQHLNVKAAHERRLRKGSPTPEQLAAVELLPCDE